MKTFSYKKTKQPPAGKTAGSHKVSYNPEIKKQSGAVRQILAPSPVQPKLKISEPNDPYEQEAERISSQIMKMPDRSTDEEEPVQTSSLINTITPLIQCSEEEEEEARPRLLQRQGNEDDKEEYAQTKQDFVRPGAPAGLASRIQTIKRGGQPLPASDRSFFEPKFGTSFKNVKIHTDTHSSEAAGSINAKAFTAGQNIVFGQGQYSPGTDSGKRLLAHELTHVVQQSNGSLSQNVQRDFSVAPTTPNRAVRTLTAQQISAAIAYNSVLFTDAAEISIIRDVLGTTQTPAVIDNDFVNAVLRYQASYGLSQDGKLGSGTCGILYNEVKAEADRLNQPARGTPLRRVERRLYLRSRVPRRRGVIVHQGFVGPDARPRGVVTVRVNAYETALLAGADRAISLDYTGSDANNVHWLQFVNRSFYGFQPGSRNRIYNTGNITTFSGTYAYTRPGSTTWHLDNLNSAASPFVDVVAPHITVRTPNRSVVMVDQPGGSTAAMRNTFSASQTPHLDRLVMRATFDAYAVLNNRVIYRIRWYATYRYNLTTGAASTVRYSTGTTGTRSTLIGAQRTVLRGRFPGNTIP